MTYTASRSVREDGPPAPAVTRGTPAPVTTNVAPAPVVTYTGSCPVHVYVPLALAVLYSSPASVHDYAVHLPAAVSIKPSASAVEYGPMALAITYTARAPVCEYLTHAPAVLQEAPAPLSEYVPPVPAVTCEATGPVIADVPVPQIEGMAEASESNHPLGREVMVARTLWRASDSPSCIVTSIHNVSLPNTILTAHHIFIKAHLRKMT